jgi:hypothetical protein
MLCSIANVPISTYYRYLIKGKFNAWNPNFSKMLISIKKSVPDSWGSRRIQFELFRRYKVKASKNKILRYLNNLNLTTRPRWQRVNSPLKTKETLPDVKNLLLDNRGKPDFKKIKKPCEAFSCDYSTIHNDGHKGNQWNVLIVMDIATRFIVHHSYHLFKNVHCR